MENIDITKTITPQLNQAEISPNPLPTNTESSQSSQGSNGSSKWLVPTLAFGLIASLGSTAFFAYQYIKMGNHQTIDRNKVVSPSIPSLNSTSEPTLPINPSQDADKNFTYKNFSISYPDDWKLMEPSESNSPVKEIFSVFSDPKKVIIISKNGTYLITIIEPEADVGTGGIFWDEEEYNEFISNRDVVVIGSSTFYLDREHDSADILLNAHSGYFMWSALSEFIPEKQAAGKVYKGYEDVIKRNGYIYDFIVTSNEGGTTNPQIQEEIIKMLETVKW